MINENTGINTRYSACRLDDPFMDGPTAPTIDQLGKFYLKEGVKLAVSASRKAIEEWGGDASQITQIVATTCTNSANPGYDYYVARELGLGGNVERTLLHGVGCAGGMTALRTAANLALGATHLRKPARILVVTCELSSLMARSELDSIAEEGDLRIGVTIFADGSSALILSNGIGEDESKPVYDLLGWEHYTIPETDHDIGFDVHPNG
jgi:fungal type III polyketide synthase